MHYVSWKKSWNHVMDWIYNAELLSSRSARYMSTRMVMQAFMVASTFLHRSPFSQTLWTSSLSSSCSRLALWTTTCNTRPMVSCYNMNTPSLSTRTQTSGEVVAEKLSTTATKDEPALEVLSCNTWQRRANSHRERRVHDAMTFRLPI